MTWLLPTASCVAVVVKDAEPFAREPLPSSVPLSKNDTVPPGVPAPGGRADTVVVKVTAWPKTELIGAAVTAVVTVLAWPTI